MMENKKTTLQQDSPPPKGLGMMLSSLFIECMFFKSGGIGDCWAARSNYEDLKLSYPRSPRCIHIPGICFEIDLSIYLESIQ